MANTRIPLDYKQPIKKAVHNLSEVVRTTLHTGLDTPVYFRRMFAGDGFDVSIPSYKVMAQSTVFPVLANFRVRHEMFFEPDSNLYGWMQNNDKKSQEFFIKDARKNIFRYPYNSSDVEEAFSYLRTFDKTSTVAIGDTYIRLYNENQKVSDVGSSAPIGSQLSYTTIVSYILKYGSLIDMPIDIPGLDRNYRALNVLNVRPGSLFDYIGIPSGFIPLENDDPIFCLDYILAYLDYWRCYHRNTQEQDIPFCRGYFKYNLGSGNSFERFGTYLSQSLESAVFGHAIMYASDSKEMLDELFRLLHTTSNGIYVNPALHGATVPLYNSQPLPAGVSYLPTGNNTIPALQHRAVNALGYYLLHCNRPSGGLMPSTYAPDLWKNILNGDTEDIQSFVQVNNYKDDNGNTVQGISITDFRFSNRIQLIAERFKVSGGRISNWLESIRGVDMNRRLDIPYLFGVLTDYIGTTTVTSTSDTASSDGTTGSDLGQMAAKVDQTRGSNRDFHIYASENGIMCIIVSIVPEVDYYQNIQPYLRDKTFIDEWLPQMSNKGFEEIPREQYSALPIFSNGSMTPNRLDMVVGQQVAWLREMTGVNRLHGEFTTNGLYEKWVLGRKYQYVDEYIGGQLVTYKRESSSQNGAVQNIYPITIQDSNLDMSTYVDPLDWQYIWNGLELDSPSWYYQAKINIRAVRPIGRRFMPTLE